MFLDVLIISFFVFGLYKGYKVGILKSLIKFISSVLSLVCSFILARPFSIFIGEKLQLKQKMSNYLSTFIDDINLNNLASTMINKSLSKYDIFNNLPEYFQTKIISDIIKDNQLVIHLSDYISQYLVYILSFIILTFLLKQIINIILTTTKFIFKLPIVKQGNKLLGSIFYSFNFLIIGIIIATLLQFIMIYFHLNTNINLNSFLLNIIYKLFI